MNSRSAGQMLARHSGAICINLVQRRTTATRIRLIVVTHNHRTPSLIAVRSSMLLENIAALGNPQKAKGAEIQWSLSRGDVLRVM